MTFSPWWHTESGYVLRSGSQRLPTLTPLTPRLMEEIIAVMARRARLIPLGRVCSVEKGPTMSWNSISAQVQVMHWPSELLHHLSRMPVAMQGAYRVSFLRPSRILKFEKGCDFSLSCRLARAPIVLDAGRMSYYMLLCRMWLSESLTLFSTVSLGRLKRHDSKAPNLSARGWLEARVSSRDYMREYMLLNL